MSARRGLGPHSVSITVMLIFASSVMILKKNILLFSKYLKVDKSKQACMVFAMEQREQGHIKKHFNEEMTISWLSALMHILDLFTAL